MSALTSTSAEARMPDLVVIFSHSTCGPEFTGTIFPALLVTVLTSGPRLPVPGNSPARRRVPGSPGCGTFRKPGPGSSPIAFALLDRGES